VIIPAPTPTTPMTWLITGTSSGFGRHLTEQLLDRGDTVAATLRNPARLDELARRHGRRLWTRSLDVTNTAQVRRTTDEAFSDLGRIDVVVSNAGYGLFGAAEELSDEQIERHLATNVTGAIALVRAALPGASGNSRLERSLRHRNQDHVERDSIDTDSPQTTLFAPEPDFGRCHCGQTIPNRGARRGSARRLGGPRWGRAGRRPPAPALAKRLGLRLGWPPQD
jgi:NAD(P)-dependent dehydrogenase (short-subunit alcohol dehydrogenase family)